MAKKTHNIQAPQKKLSSVKTTTVKKSPNFGFSLLIKGIKKNLVLGARSRWGRRLGMQFVTGRDLFRLVRQNGEGWVLTEARQQGYSNKEIAQWLVRDHVTEEMHPAAKPILTLADESPEAVLSRVDSLNPNLSAKTSQKPYLLLKLGKKEDFESLAKDWLYGEFRF